MFDPPYFLNLYDPIRNLSFVKIKHRRQRRFTSHKSIKYGFVRTQIMPVRTTPFQEFVTHIYEQLENGEVIHSAMLQEKYAKSRREIDVLVRRVIFGKEINIAIECRERDESKKSFNTRQSIEWIDGLIGKYIDLVNIQEVIAVSKSGFSQPAKDKGEAHKIKTLTLDEANEIDWNNKFLKLFAKTIKREDFPVSVILETEKGILSSISLQSPVFTDKYIGTIEQIARDCHISNLAQIDSVVENFIRTEGEKVFTKGLTFKWPATPSQDIYIFDNEEKIRILRLHIEIKSVFRVDDINANRYVFDGSGVTESRVKTDDAQTHQIIAVQEEGKDPVIKMYQIEDTIKRVTDKKKPKP